MSDHLVISWDCCLFCVVLFVYLLPQESFLPLLVYSCCCSGQLVIMALNYPLRIQTEFRGLSYIVEYCIALLGKPC
jgi:hypothetical protein